MSNEKVGLPKGMRDFGPEVMAKRQHILDAIRSVFRKFGFQALETPAMENLSVLTGKYGDEGDQLIFKVLNSGDYLSKVDMDAKPSAKELTPAIAEKALKYDLTVPFARFVAANRNDLAFPFRRYQIQPVWRADRPQRGRYREFYQCDADVVGTDSLVCEAEIALMVMEVFQLLGIADYSILINNRKVLEGMAETLGIAEHFPAFTVAIDKLDKIGKEKVIAEMCNAGIPEDKATLAFSEFLDSPASNLSFSQTLDKFSAKFKEDGMGAKGIRELKAVASFLKLANGDADHVRFDPTLARGLSYYTGAIFEVKVNNVSIGSVCGGGRYDNLTGLFGLPGMSGVGISFGVDRIYDVMEELGLFPEEVTRGTEVLVTNFDGEATMAGFALVNRLRQAGISAELFPDAAKLKKQLNYANQKKVPYVVLLGSEEIKNGQLTLKDMDEGTQETMTAEELIQKLKS